MQQQVKMCQPKMLQHTSCTLVLSTPSTPKIPPPLQHSPELKAHAPRICAINSLHLGLADPVHICVNRIGYLGREPGVQGVAKGGVGCASHAAPWS
jgi:hypothetical protein